MTRKPRGSSKQIEREHQRLRRLLELHDRERRLIAYEIHDGFVQDVLSAQFGIDGMLEGLAASDPESVAPLLRVRSFIRKAIEESRRIVSELRPATTDDTGLVESIQFLVDEAQTTSRLAVQFKFPKDFGRLSPFLERCLARIVQESLQNVKLHAKTKEAEVRLSQSAGRVRLEIEDHGVGFDPGSIPPGHFGLEGIRERARVFGGKMTVRSQPGQGTTVSVIVPIEESAGEIEPNDHPPIPRKRKTKRRNEG